VNGRRLGALYGLAGILLVLAQDAYPAWAGFHTWEYATLLAIVAAAAFSHARRVNDLAGLLGLLGALVIVAAGLGSGLLGPDTEIVARAPGTVAPLPDVGAAAFFPNADAPAIASGAAAIVLRRRTGAAIDVAPGERRFLGATELQLVPQVAAYIEARDRRGEHLTITQPTNAAFLSPVLLFAERVPVAGKLLPADGFAVPAARRQVKAFYFSKADSQAAQARGMAGVESLLFAVDDEGGRLVRGAIGFARSGSTVELGGLRLKPTLGSYPALAISAVPYPPALAIGGLLFMAGLALSFAGGRNVLGITPDERPGMT
jgi:hypothetical protein